MDKAEFLDLAASVAAQVPQANFSQNGKHITHYTLHSAHTPRCSYASCFHHLCLQL
jgi:hypothetical protein